jgi:hypothetical protein
MLNLPRLTLQKGVPGGSEYRSHPLLHHPAAAQVSIINKYFLIGSVVSLLLVLGILDRETESAYSILMGKLLGKRKTEKKWRVT